MIQQLIKSGKVKEAIKELLLNAKSTEEHNNLMLLSSRYSMLCNNSRQGIISGADERMESARIAKALLEYVPVKTSITNEYEEELMEISLEGLAGFSDEAQSLLMRKDLEPELTVVQIPEFIKKYNARMKEIKRQERIKILNLLDSQRWEDIREAYGIALAWGFENQAVFQLCLIEPESTRAEIQAVRAIRAFANSMV